MKRTPPVLVIAIALLVLFQTGFLLKLTNDAVFHVTPVQSNAAGTVSLCLNRPPTITNNCSNDINQSTWRDDNTHICQVDVFTDVGESTNFTYNQIYQNGLNFSINDSGFTVINGNQTAIGSFYVNLESFDNASVCPMNATAQYVFQIVDINDPPQFIGSLQGLTINDNAQVSYVFLDDFFTDADGDNLNYTSSSSLFTITILPSSEVIIFNPEGQCEDEVIYFTAYDSSNDTDVSNMISLDAVCTEQTQQSSGGGGGSSSSCIEDWKCHRWGACTPNGTRSRLCVDLNGCNLNNLDQTFYESCVYQPTCFDGIQNQDETGIDCGGVCQSCSFSETCFDGIKNQDETGVDCGGSICDVCIEEPTCSDGIQNQGETGVDCGGPCEACKEIHIPGIVESNNNVISTSLIILSSLVALLIAYIIFRKEIKTIFAKLMWWLKRRKRKQVLLSDLDKVELLKVVRDIERKVSAVNLSDSFKSTERIVRRLISLNRLYIAKAFDLPLEFVAEDLNAKAENILVHSSLVNLFKSFMKKQEMFEKKVIIVSGAHLFFMVQELKELILSTSNYTKGDHYGASSELQVVGSDLSKIIRLLFNSMIALQFTEVNVAKERYLKVLALYETLSVKEKTLIYDDVSRLYFHIGYLLAWA